MMESYMRAKAIGAMPRFRGLMAAFMGGRPLAPTVRVPPAVSIQEARARAARKASRAGTRWKGKR